MILVSWNVAGRRPRLDEQADRVLELEPDFVCLQEVTPVTAEPWLRRLAGAGPRVVLGDLNTPRKEHADGSVWTFARDRYGRLRPERGERWDAAESALIRGLEPDGFRDAFRELHGFDSKEPTWEWPRGGGGYRLDHLIASAEVEVTECAYRHDWRREDRLSDHSALVARLRIEDPTPR